MAIGRIPKRQIALIMVCVGTMLVGCGGGGSNDLTPPTISTGGGTATGSLMLFVVRDSTGAATALRAVRWDTDTPTVVDFDSAASIGQRRGLAEYFIASGSPAAFTDLRRDLAIYNRSDGRLYRIDLQASNSPTRRQVSSESAAASVCGVYVANAGFGDRTHMWYAYELTIGDSDCATTADNVWRLVNAEMTATDAPIVMYRPITEILNSDWTQIVGWLVQNDTRLERYDGSINPASRVQILDVPGVSMSPLATSASNRIALRIGHDLRVFDPATNSLSPIYRTFSNLGPFAADESHLYFVDAGVLYRFEFDAASPASPVRMSTEAVYTSQNHQVYLSPTRVVFRAASGEIKSLPKTATNLTAMTLVSPATGEDLRVFVVDGAQVAFTGNVQATNVRRAGLVADNDATTVVPFANAIWVGAPVSPQGSAFSWRIDSLLLSGYHATNLQAGQPLASYTSAGTLLESLGNVPSGVWTLMPGNSYIGSKVLATGTTTGTTRTDLYRLDLRAGNSLVQVTDTVGVGENEQDVLWQ